MPSTIGMSSMFCLGFYDIYEQHFVTNFYVFYRIYQHSLDILFSSSLIEIPYCIGILYVSEVILHRSKVSYVNLTLNFVLDNLIALIFVPFYFHSYDEIAKCENYCILLMMLSKINIHCSSNCTFNNLFMARIKLPADEKNHLKKPSFTYSNKKVFNIKQSSIMNRVYWSVYG